jgi:hypothetical protein
MDSSFFLGNFVIKWYTFFMPLQSQKETLTESLTKIIGYYLKNKS